MPCPRPALCCLRPFVDMLRHAVTCTPSANVGAGRLRCSGTEHFGTRGGGGSFISSQTMYFPFGSERSMFSPLGMLHTCPLPPMIPSMRLDEDVQPDNRSYIGKLSKVWYCHPSPAAEYRLVLGQAIYRGSGG